jgi:hypothetical protein
MAETTEPPRTRTGKRISGYCSVDYGHRSCSPGPVMVRGEEAVPQHCFCPCHDERAAR